MVHYKVPTVTGVLSKIRVDIPSHWAECSQEEVLSQTSTSGASDKVTRCLTVFHGKGGLRNCPKNLWARCKEYYTQVKVQLGWKMKAWGESQAEILNLWLYLIWICLHINWLLLAVWSLYVLSWSPSWRIKSIKANKSHLQGLIRWRRVWKQDVSSCIRVLGNLCIHKGAPVS